MNPVNRQLLRTVVACVRNPAQVRFLAEWKRTFWLTPLEDRKPWLTFSAREWLDRHVGSDTKVFEWGSGGSTLFFLDKGVGEICSVDHDPEWYQEIVSHLPSERHINYVLLEPDTSIRDHRPGYTSKRFRSGTPASFFQYVTYIDRFPDQYFDLILIDGRARVSCARHAVAKIKPGGCILLDNSERLDYREVAKLFEPARRKDLGGVCPYRNGSWLTSIWQF